MWTKPWTQLLWCNGVQGFGNTGSGCQSTHKTNKQAVVHTYPITQTVSKQPPQRRNTSSPHKHMAMHGKRQIQIKDKLKLIEGGYKAAELTNIIINIIPLNAITNWPTTISTPEPLPSSPTSQISLCILHTYWSNKTNHSVQYLLIKPKPSRAVATAIRLLPSLGQAGRTFAPMRLPNDQMWMPNIVNIIYPRMLVVICPYITKHSNVVSLHLKAYVGQTN